MRTSSAECQRRVMDGALMRGTGGSQAHLVVDRLAGVLLASLCSLALVPGSPALADQGCPNEKLRSEQPFATGLADCRAYEMVSPLEKQDADAVSANSNKALASLSGDTLAYESRGSYSGAEAHVYYSAYLARRNDTGWVNQPISPPAKTYHYDLLRPIYEQMLFTPELTAGIALADDAFAPAVGEPGFEYYYRTHFGSSAFSYELVNPSTCFEAEECEAKNREALEEMEIGGASADLSHVVYSEVTSSTEGWAIFESDDGTAAQVNLTTGGELIPNAGLGGGYAKASPGGDYGFKSTDTWRAVSADGQRIVFTSPQSDSQHNRRLYVREDSDRTIEVSASERGTPDASGPGSAIYEGASVDGSRVFFTDCAKLTNDATADDQTKENRCNVQMSELDSVEEPGVGNDLYEYDFEKPAGERLSDLTVDASEPEGARVLGVVGVSEDGTYLYVVAKGVLSTGENAYHEHAVSGQPSLYLLRQGAAPVFIATLAPATSVQHNIGGDISDWRADIADDSVRQTPDGTRLAFLSTAPLGGYHSEPEEARLCETEGRQEPCSEVYLYNAATNALRCVSCSPDGVRPLGRSSFQGGEGAAGTGVPESETTKWLMRDHAARNFSANGRRLFFDTKNAIVPHDSNGLMDVYEWEEDGEGSCEQTGGCVFPVSDVAGGYGSFFLEAGPSGDDAFIATEDQLVPSDTDYHIDIYDARVDGGYPVIGSPPGCDNADSCKLPVSPQPALFGAPATETFSGIGNVGVEPAHTVQPARKTTRTATRKRCGKAADKNRRHNKCARARRQAKKGDRPGNGRRTRGRATRARRGRLSDARGAR